MRIPEGIERVQIDALVFHRPPQPLNENVIHPVTLTIHRYTNISGLYGIHPDRTGELTTLIGVKNPWRSIASSLVARGGIELVCNSLK